MTFRSGFTSALRCNISRLFLLSFLLASTAAHAVAPTITGQGLLATDEDNAMVVTLGDLTVDDVDSNYPNDFTIAAQAGANYTATPAGNNKSVTITPDPDYNGALTVNVTVNDGVDDSTNVWPLAITVNAVNDAPTITGQAVLATNEDVALVVTLGNLTVTDPDIATGDNTYPGDYTLAAQDLPNDNYTATLAGDAKSVTITPDPDYNGPLTVDVTVNDGVDNSTNTWPLAITVNAANDAPTITGQDLLATNEDTALVVTLNNLTVTDPDIATGDNTYPADYTMAAQAGANYTAALAGDNKSVTITPSANYNGPLSVQVTVNDGSTNSNAWQYEHLAARDHSRL
jgi:hypothetical protein